MNKAALELRQVHCSEKLRELFGRDKQKSPDLTGLFCEKQ